MKNLLEESVKQLLLIVPDDNRKTISVSLKSNQLANLDEMVAYLEKRLNRSFSRQAFIEIAIEAYLAEIKNILNSESEDDFLSDYINPEHRKLEEDYNTIVLPARYKGIETFFEDKEWYWVRIGRKINVDKLKYVALYIGAPTSAITHYAKIRDIPEIEGKFKFIIDEPIELPNSPVKLGNIHSASVRSNRYVSLEKLLSAKTYGDLIS